MVYKFRDHSPYFTISERMFQELLYRGCTQEVVSAESEEDTVVSDAVCVVVTVVPASELLDFDVVLVSTAVVVVSSVVVVVSGIVVVVVSEEPEYS